MKKTIAVLAVALLLTSCKTPEQCTQAQTAYDAYITALSTGGATEKQIEQARLAATVLTTTCNWIASRDGVDTNGVPRVSPPEG